MMMHQMDAQPPPLVAIDSDNSSASGSLNPISSATTIATLLSSIKSLEKEIQTLKQPSVDKATDKTINPRTGKKWKRYCWTCGCCPHSGKYCPNKAPGHQDSAIFANRMGGSNKNCRPIEN